MPYSGVRVVQYLVLAGLFAAVLVLLRRRAGVWAAVWFAVSQLLVTVFWVPHQIQYFTCFAVAYAGLCLGIGQAPPQRYTLPGAGGPGCGDGLL